MLFHPITKTPGPLTPIVLIHGTGGNAQEELDRFRTTAEATLSFNVLLIAPQFETPYQFLLPRADRVLLDALDQAKAEHELADRIMLYGFSGGAQFAHRFTMRHPEEVMSCVALAAGCWTDPSGTASGMMIDEDWFRNEPWNAPGIAEAARQATTYAEALKRVRWLIGCGTRDHASRLRSAEQFQVALAEAGCGVDYLDWDGDHDDMPGHVIENVLHFLNEAQASARAE